MAANPLRQRLVKIDLKQTVKRSQDAISKGFEDTAEEMTTAIQKTLSVQGTRKARSAPGEAPRRQVGTLQAGTSVERVGFNLQVRTLQYGLFLDPNGTKGIRNRPFIDPTITDRKKFWKRRLNANIRKHAK